MSHYEKTSKRSEEGLALLRKTALKTLGDGSSLIIGLNGSFARREATTGSDLDLFYLIEDGETEHVEGVEKFGAAIGTLNFKPPAAGGVFDSPLAATTLVTNIGGMEDNNRTITRRMLFLLEGDWIYNKPKFEEVRRNIIAAYVPDALREKQICLFLLNDIIRYWRTICIDFEFKAKAGAKAKAIRLIKLRFSRMLIYLAGLLAVAETHEKDAAEKRASLVKHFELSPIDRIRSIAGEAATDVLKRYDHFLESIDNPAIREKLDGVGLAAENTEEFKGLNSAAHDFRTAIAELVAQLYPSIHPIHLALMF